MRSPWLTKCLPHTSSSSPSASLLSVRSWLHHALASRASSPVPALLGHNLRLMCLHLPAVRNLLVLAPGSRPAEPRAARCSLALTLNLRNSSLLHISSSSSTSQSRLSLLLGSSLLELLSKASPPHTHGSASAKPGNCFLITDKHCLPGQLHAKQRASERAGMPSPIEASLICPDPDPDPRRRTHRATCSANNALYCSCLICFSLIPFWSHFTSASTAAHS